MTLDDIDVTEWATPRLVRQFAELKVANVLGRRTMVVDTSQWFEGLSYKLLDRVVLELRSRGVLDYR